VELEFLGDVLNVRRRRKKVSISFLARIADSFMGTWLTHFYSVPQNSFPLPTGSIFSFATPGSALGKDYAVAIVTLFCGTLYLCGIMAKGPETVSMNRRGNDKLIDNEQSRYPQCISPIEPDLCHGYCHYSQPANVLAKDHSHRIRPVERGERDPVLGLQVLPE
jgi:hypothetical protein